MDINKKIENNKNRRSNEKMKREGFTLIELLAVIVILAIIAVIATPIIVGIIEDSRKAAFERSVEGIIHATDIDFGTQEALSSDPYTISNGVLNKTLKTPIKNIDGFSGTIKYDEKGNSTYAIYNDKWCMIKVNGVITTTDYVEDECEIPNPYANGKPIYFDVVNGVGCTNYHQDNSKTGYNGITKTTENQTSCLKFYAFLYNEGDAEVKLLLDHNTTATVKWNSSKSNATGPETPEESTTEILGKLKTDTASWNGTITPENYQLSQTTGGNYTIDYSDYKARLISANEVAEITGNTSFDESTTSYSNWFYFDTNSQTSSGTHNYGWLYDRTSTTCTTSGCENNSDSLKSGYWTSTSAFGSSDRVWIVNEYGSLSSYYVYSNGYGVRPVIEVPVSNL